MKNTGTGRDRDLEAFAETVCSPRLGSDLGRVGRKFVSSMLMGIYGTRSVNLTDVARGLSEGISLHATHKRLSRNMQDPELNQNLSDRLLRLGAEKVREDTLIIAHVYSINKKYARKMEFLPLAEQASAGAGFSVCEILASHPESKTYTPLLTTVWSDQVPGFVSDADEIRKAVMRVFAATDNRGLLCFDDRILAGSFVQHLIRETTFDFLVVMKREDMDVIYRQETCSLHKLLDQVETRYAKNVYKLIPEGIVGASKTDVDLYMHVGSVAIKIPDCERRVSVIGLRTENPIIGESVTPIITSRTNLNSRKSLMGLVDSFLSVHDILAAHQALRDSFNPANFRVLTYDRLQLLMTLLQAVMHFEASKRCVSVDRRFAGTPHGGELDRTYILPG